MPRFQYCICRPMLPTRQTRYWVGRRPPIPHSTFQPLGLWNKLCSSYKFPSPYSGVTGYLLALVFACMFKKDEGCNNGLLLLICFRWGLCKLDLLSKSHSLSHKPHLNASQSFHSPQCSPTSPCPSYISIRSSSPATTTPSGPPPSCPTANSKGGLGTYSVCI